MPQTEPIWTEDEEALRVAYELSPNLRTRYQTFDLAMKQPPVALALRVFAKARLRNKKEHANGKARIED